ncbi:MAG: AAA family ATPase, partial [Segetibacter sp.]
MPHKIELNEIKKMLAEQGYITDDSVSMSVFLSLQLNKPLLIEGPAGVGKTEIAKVMARAMETDLIRLQCYEGLDSSHALYEWNYQRQLLHLKMVEHNSQSRDEKEKTIFSDEFLMKRPLL